MQKTVRVSDLDHEPEAVLYARKNAGLSQVAAAKQLGISGAYLSQIESGVRNAAPALINRMAKLYDCPRVVLIRKGRWSA